MKRSPPRYTHAIPSSYIGSDNKGECIVIKTSSPVLNAQTSRKPGRGETRSVEGQRESSGTESTLKCRLLNYRVYPLSLEGGLISSGRSKTRG